MTHVASQLLLELTEQQPPGPAPESARSVRTLTEWERDLVATAAALGAASVGGPLTRAEQEILAAVNRVTVDNAAVEAFRAAIVEGGDPLGDWYTRAQSTGVRRTRGQYYTPDPLVDTMISWVASERPDRVVDGGCGSGRFVSAVLRLDRDKEVVAVDLDPLATVMTRAVASVLCATETTVVQGDFTSVDLVSDRRTAWVGNPPYVRHHGLSAAQKAWASTTADSLGVRASGLAGLHAHFLLKIAQSAKPSDVGCLVMSSEWLDVLWGGVIRDLLVDGLGGLGIDLVSPRATPFEDAMTTAAVVTFRAGSRPSYIRLREVADPTLLSPLASGSAVEVSRLQLTTRWSSIIRGDVDGPPPAGLVTLGSIARVHRGAVTGSNKFFVLSEADAFELGILEWCRPAITRASEIFEAEGQVRATPHRRLVLDAPSTFDWRSNRALVAYLRSGRADGASLTYVARHRSPWWRLGVKEPPPIVATYMGRRPPAFALNPDGLLLTNIAHGIYPHSPMTPVELARFVGELNLAARAYAGRGRTYHGGLEKFEPREMEALLIRNPREP